MQRIRTATLADIPSIQSIAHRTWPVTFDKILSPDQITYMLEMMYGRETLAELIKAKQTIFLLGLDETQTPVGFAAYECRCKGKKNTKINKLYVLPSAQGLGVGRALCSEISLRALVAGDESLTLNVNKFNQPAMAFYQKAGFQVVAEETIPIGKGYLMEDFVMEKPLI
ncbi:MAG: GNAT family N-acetyltransferase [Lunatimonas sp.]|uniref:GNAT family N-acetyltransferase n=1 Tax=Lunatimonas sp. TaxID=2060141 RepID=UPI00263B1654|nr:N-acetyltransferase [Lunatimonas sp.]MCC5936316.1 GNAT family N-acetyltransferase [Lunatimonas sp.]